MRRHLLTTFYGLYQTIVKSGHSGFYPLYLCQAEVCPSDAERQKKIERVTEMDIKKIKKNNGLKELIMKNIYFVKEITVSLFMPIIEMWLTALYQLFRNH